MTLDGVMSWAVQTGLVVSLLIVGILLIRRPFARMFGAGAAYALWSLPVIRLFLPVISIPSTWLPGRFRPQPETEVAATYQTVPGEAVMPFIERSASEGFVAPAQTSFEWGAVILGLWLGVALSWLAFQLLRQRAFLAEMKRTSVMAGEDLTSESRLAATVTGLKRLPAIRLSEQNIGPFVTGVLKPTVILPSGFAQDFTEDQRHYALVHEFAHVKRRDLWVAFAALIFRAINWFNPLVHYAAHKMRVDQEAACDAFVVAKTGQSGGNTLDYAKTLLQAAKTTGSSTAGAHLALSLMEADQNEIEGKGDFK